MKTIKNSILINLLSMVCSITINAQAVYVDSSFGDDKNPGTKESPVFSINKAAEIIKSSDNDIYVIKINPGIYILDKHVSIATEKKMTGKRIVFEASVLPDCPLWAPEKMPVITCRAIKGEIPEFKNIVVSFLVNESHVTIRGIKFHGYFYPHTRYFPITRLDKTKTDLLVEQCLFVGDANISQIQAVYVDGNGAMFDHCVFYKVRNTVVFGRGLENEIKTGNGITNSIIYAANQGVWTIAPDKDFKFENNIVSNCMYGWVKGNTNSAKYTIKNCVIANNKYFQGVPDSVRLNPGVFEITEENVIKHGEIKLRLTGVENNPTLNSVDQPLPIDYMHIIPNTLGYSIGAGIFKKRK